MSSRGGFGYGFGCWAVRLPQKLLYIDVVSWVVLRLLLPRVSTGSLVCVAGVVVPDGSLSPKPEKKRQRQKKQTPLLKEFVVVVVVVLLFLRRSRHRFRRGTLVDRVGVGRSRAAAAARATTRQQNEQPDRKSVV